jgi:putative endopeptidase
MIAFIRMLYALMRFVPSITLPNLTKMSIRLSGICQRTWSMPTLARIATLSSFPAAILQKPFYSATEQTPSQNYGGIGAVIAHEISHAFDNNGALFDAFGNMNNWWTDEDFKAFEARQELMIAEFDGPEIAGGNVNGQLVVSENIADAGGLTAAMTAALREPDADLKAFFTQWGEIWRLKASEEYQQMLLSMDVHAPGKLRANVQASNLDEFFATFGVKEGDGMWRAEADRVKIW